MKLNNPLVGLAGVLIAAMSTELNSTLSAIALPDITAGFGISHDAATWFASIYATAVVVGMCLAPWLAVTFTLRRVSLFAIVLACLTTVMVPFAPNVEVLYLIRAAQGLAGGLTTPLLMTTALRVLAPPIRLYGLACYALTATFFPSLSNTIAALWGDVLNWHFVFYQSIPLAALAAALVWSGMPIDDPRYERLSQFDWRGLLLIVLGLGSFTTLLQQGDRLDWFHSQSICLLALISVIAIPFLILNEWFHPLPLLKLQFLTRRNFAYGVTTLCVFLIIGALMTELPAVYLEEVQGYRPLQTHLITLTIALMQLLLLPLAAWILDFKWLDSRLVSFIGLLCVLIASVGASYLDVHWNREQFYLWMLFLSIGEAAIVVPLLMMATNTVKGPHEGPFASALVNAPRAVAETAGVWLLQLIFRFRGGLHGDRIVDHLGSQTYLRLSGNGGHLLATVGSVGASPREIAELAARVQIQALILTISDGYLIVAALAVGLMIWVSTFPERTYPPRIQFARH